MESEPRRPDRERCRNITFVGPNKLQCELDEGHPRAQDHRTGGHTWPVEPTIHIDRVTGAQTEEWHNP